MKVEDIAKKRLIALYDYSGSILISEVRRQYWCEQENRPYREDEFVESDDTLSGTRISEIVEINFQPLDSETLVSKMLRGIDREERDARERLQKILDSLNDRRRDLLAISHESEP